MEHRYEVDRRTFLRILSAAGGMFVFGVSASGCDDASPASKGGGALKSEFRPNAFLRIAPGGEVTVIVPKVEMGQGVMTALATLVADELDADWKDVRVEFAPADPAYALGGGQSTGGSASVRGFFQPLRHAGAAARAMLVAAAAQRMGVAKQECRTEPGVVIHGPSRRRLAYGELAADAAKLPVPKKVFLKRPEDFRYIGKPMARLDTPPKVRGSAIFGQDVIIPGMKIAMVERCPAFGGTVKRFDARAARELPGVHDIFPISSGIAVVADSFPAAQRARDAISIEWKFPGKRHDEAAIATALDSALPKAETVREEGNPDRHLGNGQRTVEADYHVPYQAHACLEPMNCTVHVRSGDCEIWVPTQAPDDVQSTAAEITGLDPSGIDVHTTFLGGGFGRRLETDFVAEAVEIGKRVHAPVKLLWTRQDDMRHDFYRPVSRHRLRASWDEKGRPLAWEHRIASPSILARWQGSGRNDGTSTDVAKELPYGFSHLRVAYAPVDLGIPVGFWRSVGASQNVFVTECFIDEIAAATGKDPVELRRQLLETKPKHRHVLELAAEKADWGKPMPKGRARGIAVAQSFHSYVAEVAEVSIVDNRVRVHRVVCAIDCGFVVNPDIVRAQMEGAVCFALTAALKSAITVHDGRVEQSSFVDFPLLRFSEMPEVEVHIVASDDPPRGVGEPGVPPCAPAVANAVFALTGRPVRRLPIQPGATT